jgi:excinuclease ABC subunit B
MAETERRRTMQLAYNARHGITPQTIQKPIREKEVEIADIRHVPRSEIPNLIIELEADMREAAERLEFERAIALRDTIRKLQEGGTGEARR